MKLENEMLGMPIRLATPISLSLSVAMATAIVQQG
jgi:hypothetical protein